MGVDILYREESYRITGACFVVNPLLPQAEEITDHRAVPQKLEWLIA